MIARPLPSVSVVLIVRNGERFIAEALASVVQGTLPPAEIVVVDGHSSDRTVAIANSFDGVRVIPQTAIGTASAYNEGIAAATGELIAFISHDDRWHPEKLARQARYMSERTDLAYTVTHVRHVLDDGATPPPGFRIDLLERDVPGLLMESLVARRKAFTQVGCFDPDFDVSADTDWFARARDARLPMAILPQTLVTKRVHHANTSLQQPEIASLLLRAMRRSVERKRAQAADA